MILTSDADNGSLGLVDATLEDAVLGGFPVHGGTVHLTAHTC